MDSFLPMHAVVPAVPASHRVDEELRSVLVEKTLPRASDAAAELARLERVWDDVLAQCFDGNFNELAVALHLHARRVYVTLLAEPVLDSRRHPQQAIARRVVRPLAATGCHGRGRWCRCPRWNLRCSRLGGRRRWRPRLAATTAQWPARLRRRREEALDGREPLLLAQLLCPRLEWRRHRWPSLRARQDSCVSL